MILMYLSLYLYKPFILLLDSSNQRARSRSTCRPPLSCLFNICIFQSGKKLQTTTFPKSSNFTRRKFVSPSSSSFCFNSAYQVNLKFWIQLFKTLNQSQATGTGSDQRITATDPNHQEESVMSGKLVLGVNPYREICTLHLAGQMLIEKVCFNCSISDYLKNFMQKNQRSSLSEL